MSLFTTRVELHHSSTSKDYDKLHEEMEKEGFWRYIRLDGEKEKYHLPTAEYNYGKNDDNTITTQSVLDLAKEAAKRTGLKFMVLVTKADGARKWDNLDEVKK